MKTAAIKKIVRICWGTVIWNLTNGLGCSMYLKGSECKSGFSYYIGEWLIRQYGYARNPEWPPQLELKWFHKIELFQLKQNKLTK